jgi:phosphonate utilization associated putative membrane protein
MPDSALLAIGLSVLMHVVWNLLARHVDRRCNYLWWGLLAHLVLLGPWALWRLLADSHWNRELLLAMLVTIAANTLYFLALRRAYRFAPVAVVYPVARSSPVLIALWAWLLFDQRIDLHASIGIGISMIGLWILAASVRHGDTRHALPWAMIAALATSIYSLSDKLAVNYLPSFGAQLGFISVGYLGAFIGLTVAQYKSSRALLPSCRPGMVYILCGGLFIGTAYALVVRAMLQLPAAYVVAYTNAGIVLATLVSIWLFGERESWKGRLLSAALITSGLIVLGLKSG